MKLIILSGIAMAVGMFHPAHAKDLDHEKGYFFTGNDIHAWCQSARSLAEAYTAGVWDHSARTDFNLSALKSNSGIDAASARLMLVGYCEPPGVTVGQATDVFCRHLSEKPEGRGLIGAFLFTEAMQRAWPCNKR
jgi:hypothetical protein